MLSGPENLWSISMTKYVGSTKDLIDWDSVIASIIPRSGDYNSVTSVVDRSESNWSDVPELLGSYHEIIDTWQKANYDLTNIEWWDYYPGQHFDVSIQNKFAEFVNAEPLRVFISEVMPGQCVPYHWDVEDHEKEWLKLGTLVRYVCFIDKPKFGHVLIIDQECFYNTEQHLVYEWDNYKYHHAGTNCGTDPYYLFHFLGRPRV
jgi:hypothetical protein